MLKAPLQTEYEYEAFISYRHNARDGAIAEKLHRALETYRTPRYLVKRGVASKLKKVFRDREELPTSGNLGASIERALAASRFLIVVCSPEALESKWVLREVELFSALHGIDHVIPLLAAGEPETAFPPGLIRQTLGDNGEVLETIEPLAADVRPRDNRSSPALLHTEKLRLLAALLDCKFDELRQREQERRLRRIITVSAATVVFLLAFGAFTYKQLRDVSAARADAVKNERIALETQSRLYASMARAAADGGDKLLGLSLAMEALPKDLNKPEKPLEEDAKNALYYTVARHGAQGLTCFRAGDGASSVEDAKRCFTVGEGSDAELVTVGEVSLRRYGMRTGRLTGGWTADAGEVIIAVSPRADRAVTTTLTAQGGVDVRLVDAASGTVVGKWEFHVGNNLDAIRMHGAAHFVRACFNEDGSLLFLACNQTDDACDGYNINEERAGRMALVDTATAGVSYMVPGTFSSVNSALFLANGWLAVNFRNDPAIVLDPAANVIAARINNANASGNIEDRGSHSVNVTPDGRFFVYTGMDALLHIVPFSGGTEEAINYVGARISNNGRMAAYFTIDPDTKRDNICLSDVFTGSTMVMLPDQELKTSFHFTADSRYLVFDDYRVLNTETLELSTLPKPEYAGSVIYCDISRDGRYYIFTDCNGVSGAILFRDPAVAEARLSVDPVMVAISDGGVWMAECRDDGSYSILRWDPASGNSAIAASGSGYVQALPDVGGDTLAYCVEEQSEYANYFDTIYLSISSGWKKLNIPLSTDFQIDGARKRFITIGDDGCRLWDLQTGRLIRPLNNALTVNAPYPRMHSAGFFPGGDICWSAGISPDGQYEGLMIQNTESGEVFARIPLEAPGLIAASAVLKADGKRLLTRGREGLTLWNVEDPASPIASAALKGEFLCAGPDLLALGLNNTVFLVDWRTGEIRYSLRLPESSTATLARFSPDGGSIVTLSAAADKTCLEQWDCGTGVKLAVLYEEPLPGGKTLGFDWCGGTIAVVGSHAGQAICRAFPYLDGFPDAYAYAKELLGGRVFDMNRDLVGLD